MTQETHAGQIAGAMPDPDSNIQLGENSGLAVLGGPVTTQFTYSDPGEYSDALDNARREQEAICGYRLEVGDVRETRMQDIHGRDVYEVFVTFEPAPAKG